MSATNEDIARLFEDLGALVELKGDSVFKVRAYRRAAQTIRGLSYSLARAVEEGADLRQIPGIGKAINDKVHELLRTGRVSTYDRLLAGLPGGRPTPSPQYENKAIEQTLNTNADAGPATGLAEHVPEAVLHLRSAVQSGTPWHRALLEAVGLWSLPHEERDGRTYQYLIQGEAFDWLVLAERLCLELEGVIQPEERERLLFSGSLPEEVDAETFRDLLGTNKYRGYLNYWYGVVVEEALQLSVEEDVRKRHLALCFPDSEDLVEEAFVHLYGATRSSLLEEFRQKEGIPRRRALSLSDLKGFTYWLHKRRLKMWDPARVASDTERGIRRLRALQASEGGAAVGQGQPCPANAIMHPEG